MTRVTSLLYTKESLNFSALFSGCGSTEQFYNGMLLQKGPYSLPPYAQEKNHFDIAGIEPGRVPQAI